MTLQKKEENCSGNEISSNDKASNGKKRKIINNKK